jgi:hypothetical protein
MKRLVILTGSLAVFAANVALADPTLVKSEHELVVEQKYHESIDKRRFDVSSAEQERFEGTAARGTNPAVRPDAVAYPERLFNLNP